MSNPGDADAISRIKLPARQAKDYVPWHLEKIGIFTVRSAHNLALKLEQAPNMQPDDFGTMSRTTIFL